MRAEQTKAAQTNAEPEKVVRTKASQTKAALDLSGLNERQRTIAMTLDAPLFVEAGAGSGKTFTLTQRIAWALSPGSGEGGAPFLDSLDQVLVITFTKAAAREIKERVRRTLRSCGLADQALAVDDAWISTIHNMCSRILHRHALDLGLDPSFTVVSDSAERALFDRAMDDVMRSVAGDERFSALLAEYELGTRGRSGYTRTMGIVERLLGAGSALAGGVGSLVPRGWTCAAAPPALELPARNARSSSRRRESVPASMFSAKTANLPDLSPGSTMKRTSGLPTKAYPFFCAWAVTNAEVS